MNDPDDPILGLIPNEQLDWVFDQDCDIDTSFLGFTKIYKNLSEIIPKHWTIVDLGCAYAPQAWLFKDHKEYVGVDVGDRRRFSAPNSKHYVMSVYEFIQRHSGEYNQSKTFAICSYVPDWNHKNKDLAREFFQNVFTYYPCGDDSVRFPTK